jgi:hypothetical protein
MSGHDRGSVTAELAVVMPAVVLVIVLAVASLSAAGRQVRLEQATAQAARLAARGEDDAAARAAVAAAGGVALRIGAEGDLVCVDAAAPARVPLPVPDLRARACALGEGP